MGTVLLDQNHHFRLAAVFAIQLTILFLGFGAGLRHWSNQAILLPICVPHAGESLMPVKYSLGKTLLKIENICLEYDGRPILKDVNAEVKDIIVPGKTTGQVVGFLGPSGCGKDEPVSGSSQGSINRPPAR